MKVAVLLACTCVIFSPRRVSSAAVKAPLDIISLDDLTESDRKHLEFINSQFQRAKRSGDYDALSSIKASIGNSIKSKIGMLAKGSASASGHFSSGSSGGHSYHHYDIPETYDHKSFDFWSLKKSILNTLLQAVKAIKGGVLAIKGQLIKGSGYLISAKGKLISAKGEAITTLGKNIATSAILSPSPHHHGHSGAGYVEYGHPHSYHHSGPSEEYGSPSAPGPEYEAPDHYHSHHHEDKPDVEHSGILILKKIPTTAHHHDDEHGPEHKIPDFKPIDEHGPGFGTIIGKFFKASTSLKPDEPAPFGHTSSGHDQIYDHPHESHHTSHHNHDYAESHSSHSDDHEDYPSHDSHHNNHHEYLPSPQTYSDHHVDDSKQSPVKYTSPFESAPSFLNIEYASESKKHQQQTLSNSPVKEPEKPKFQSTTPQTYDEIRPLPTSNGFDSNGYLANAYEKPNLFVATTADHPNDSFPPYPDLHVVNPRRPTVHSQFGAFESLGGNNELKYLSAPTSLTSQNFQINQPNIHYLKPSGSVKHHVYHDAVPSSGHKITVKRPPRAKPPTKLHKNPHSYNVVRSIAFELGPDGPKRL